MSDQPERSHVEAGRRAKRAELEALGIAPYAYAFERDHDAADAHAMADSITQDDGPVVRLAGRLVAWRGQGRTVFAHLEDASGRIQLYLRRDALEPSWGMIQLLDIDDHVGIEGPLFRTRSGELSVRVTAMELLAKSLRPLPRGKAEKLEDGSTVIHGGLVDPEIRFRQRYADLSVHPERREIFRLRARVIAYLRHFLDERGFLEVETPVLQPLYGGAMARPRPTA